MAASISGSVLRNPCQSGFAHGSKFENSFKGDEVKLNCGFITLRKGKHFQCRAAWQEEWLSSPRSHSP
ncbi:hypothetical protein M758_11G147200 [Ceratodon purpureus]|nr:hypothetical protein M758_11G147200 [Ceratodon purpureus]